MQQSDFATFEAVGALVVVLDPDHRILYWNRACSALTGYVLDEVRGRCLWDFLLAQDEIASVRADFDALPSSGHGHQLTNTWVTKSGEHRWIAWSNTLSRGPDGAVQYVVKTGIDRTQRKELEDQLREANQQMVGATLRAQDLTEEAEAERARAERGERELREVAEFRERFIGVVGHDLRNPLGAISMAAAMLVRRGTLAPADANVVRRIMNSTDRMTRMISQLLDLTRARLGGGFPLEPARTDLRDVCRAVIDEFSSPIDLDVAGDVEGVWDSDRLQEAVSNILGNAVEHAAEGTAVTVTAQGDGAHVVLEIANQGSPIPDDLLPFIFEPFRRANAGTRSASGNLGLGLFIAHQIAVSHGGTLEARSAAGTTVFVLRLPRGARAPHADRPPGADARAH